MSQTSRAQIREWLQEATAQGATNVIIVCDTFDYEDYPVPVMPGEDARKKAEEFDGINMQTIMEVYSLSMDIEEQLAQHRVFNYD